MTEQASGAFLEKNLRITLNHTQNGVISVLLCPANWDHNGAFQKHSAI